MNTMPERFNRLFDSKVSIKAKKRRKLSRDYAKFVTDEYRRQQADVPERRLAEKRRKGRERFEYIKSKRAAKAAVASMPRLEVA